MRAHEIVKEIGIIGISKTGMASKASMKGMYNSKDHKPHGSYDIPELPDHTIEILKYDKEVIILLIDDETDEPVAYVELISIGDYYYVDGVKVDTKLQGRGIAPTLYKFIVTDLNMPLKSGSAQSPGSAKLWARLWAMPGVNVQALYSGKKHPVTLNKETGRLQIKGGPDILYDRKRSAVLIAPKK
jgi:hypothetical protein